MNKKTLKNNLLLFAIAAIFALATVFLINGQIAMADTADGMYSDYTYVSAEVNATYNYTALDDSSCSVRIANKSQATRAIIQ